VDDEIEPTWSAVRPGVATTREDGDMSQANTMESGVAEGRLGSGAVRRGRFLAGGLTAAASLLVPRAARAQAGGPSGAEAPLPERFEVAENALRFAFAERPVHEDGMPAYGNPFVTEGYLYPPGTLNGSNGVLPDGQPEFPDKVIGSWICRGYLIGDGAHTETGPMVVSNQVYSFGGYAGTTLVTDGLELADKGVPVARAITGGTGALKGAWGEQSQVLLGFTEQMGVNLQVTLDVHRR
jgi:hypothetical protein